MRVQSIDEYGILERLKKYDKEAYNYIRALREALVRQQELTAKAIGKLKELSRND